MTIDNVLKTVLDNSLDPQFGLSIAEMGIQADWTLAENILNLNLKAGFPTKILEKSLHPLLLNALQAALPNYAVQINFHTQVKAHITQLPGKGLRGIKNVIAVGSGKGGVGKSTVAVNLAIAMAKMGAKTGILDADIYGPSIPLMLGKTQPVPIQDDKYLPIEAHGIKAMSIGYLAHADQALIWRGPMLAKSLLHMLDVTLWGDLDYLFIDLPPGTGDIQLSLVQKIPLTTAIIVTTPQQVATKDAQKALTLFTKTGINVLGIIENMAFHICSQCDHEEYIFGTGGAKNLCMANQCSLLGQLPLDMRICTDSDAGNPTIMNSDNETSEIFLKIATFTSMLIAHMPLNYASRFPDVHVEHRE